MKTLVAIFGSVLLLTIATDAIGKTVIRQAPLSWEQVKNMQGDVVFQNLCASCHGVGARGDGPAANALEKSAPDLTKISANNDGIFPHKAVERAIFGESRIAEHGTIDMPVWGQQFKYVRTGWSAFQRESYARKRIHDLAVYIESIQVY